MELFVAFMENNTTESPGRRQRVKIKTDKGVTHHQVHFMHDKPVQTFTKLITRLDEYNTAHALQLQVPAFRSYERLVSCIRWLRP